jgi:hypothetical protein
MPRKDPAAAVAKQANKPIGEIMAENDQKAAERSRRVMADNADEAQQPARPPVAVKKPPVRKPPAKPDPAPADTRKAVDQGPIQFTSLEGDDDYLVLVLYGPAGTRKTTSALRVTKAKSTGRVCVIAAESGLKRSALQQHDVDTARVVYWPKRGESVTYEGLEQLFYQLLADLEKDPHSWLAVSWDSLTEVIQTMVDNATRADIERLEAIAKMANKNIEVRKVYEREGADYGVVTQQFRQLLRKFRSLPCHQIFVALEEDRKETVETDDGRKTKVGIIGPSLTPKVREDVEQHADVIIRTTVVDVQGLGPVGLGRATPAEDLRAKDRYNVLPVVMIDPGFERVWGYVTGEIKVDQDLEQSLVADLDSSVVEALDSAKEKAEKAKADRAAKAAERRAARPAAPKAGAARSATSARATSGKVTADSGTPDNPPM